jgi:magnesium-transporting ATPase (P-type)
MHVHELTVDAAPDSLQSSAQGLKSQEATRRLVEFGPNRIEQAARVPIALRFVREIDAPGRPKKNRRFPEFAATLVQRVL